MSESMLDALARAVQNHIPEQPWSHHGHDPAPVQLFFDAHAPAHSRWGARFVTGVKGTRLTWGRASGPTLEAALQGARTMQTRT